MLSVGFHHLDDADAGAPLPAATFLDVAGSRSGMRSPARLARPYFKGNPAVSDLVQKAMFWTSRGCRVQIANEPNLPMEGWAGGVESLAVLFGEIRLAAPNARLYWPGMSPGVPGWQDWITSQWAKVGLAASNGACIHAYGTLGQMVDVVSFYLYEVPSLPLWVGEVNFGAGQTADRDAWARDHFRPFLDWCSQKPQIEAVTYFARTWPTPDMSLPTPVDGAGTAIETTLRSWVAPALPPLNPPQEVPAMPNPFAGKLLTVWNLPDDPGKVIDAALDLGCDGVEIKVADGDSSWLGRRNVTPEYVEALREGGLRVLGWTYNYCDRQVDAGDRGNGMPEIEAQVAAEAVAALGLDAITVDLEIECEGHPGEVATLIDTLRQQTTVPIAAHVWGTLEGHETYPYAEIAARVDWLRPMIYRPVWTAKESWKSWEKHLPGSTARFIPVWGITDRLASADAIGVDMMFANAHEIPGEAYWEYSGYPGQEGVRALIRARHFGKEAPADDATTSALDGVAHFLNATEDRLRDALTDVARVREELGQLKTAIGR